MTDRIDLDRTVVAVSNVSAEAEFARGTLSEVPKPNPLHPARNPILSGQFSGLHFHSLARFGPILSSGKPTRWACGNAPGPACRASHRSTTRNRRVRARSGAVLRLGSHLGGPLVELSLLVWSAVDVRIGREERRRREAAHEHNETGARSRPHARAERMREAGLGNSARRAYCDPSEEAACLERPRRFAAAGRGDLLPSLVTMTWWQLRQT